MNTSLKKKVVIASSSKAKINTNVGSNTELNVQTDKFGVFDNSCHIRPIVRATKDYMVQQHSNHMGRSSTLLSQKSLFANTVKL
jgi:hypothetical protein